MPSEKRWKRLIFRWTAPKGFTAVALFSMLALLIEYFLVCFFLSFGLTDKSLLTKTFQVPLTGLFFTMTISPLFHFIPLGVIAVLVSSWMYLMKYVAVVPRRIERLKKPSATRRRKHPRALNVRFKSIRRFSKRIGRKFRRISRTLKALYRRVGATVLRIRGVSYVMQRLFFARAAIKSTVTIFAVFLASVLALYTLAYPRLIYDAVIELYKGNPSFLGFVLKTIETAQAIGQVLFPIGWLASTINNALLAAAPGFRNALESFGASMIEPIVKLDLVWKYAICQNVAAWISAVTALAYGQYTFRPYRRKPR